MHTKKLNLPVEAIIRVAARAEENGAKQNRGDRKWQVPIILAIGGNYHVL
jgi:hypothetical protein